MENKEEKKNLFQKLNSYIPLALFVTIIGFIINDQVEKKTNQYKLETVTFDSPEQKVRHKKHVEEAPNEVDMFVATKRWDSISKLSVDNEKANVERDSLRYDLVRRNTDQIYLMNQKVSHVDSVMVEILKKVQ